MYDFKAILTYCENEVIDTRNELSSKIDSINHRIDSLREKMNNSIESLRNEMNNRINELDRKLYNRFLWILGLQTTM
jgi:uncharacterized coiled-coil DUF342 family protein